MDKQNSFDFPKIDWWRQNIVYPNDSKRFLKEHLYEYYLEKYMICRMFMPKAIAEVGVRWGYSAFSFLCASPQAAYTGFDMINGGYGGVAIDTFGHVSKLLNDNFPDAKVVLHHADTRQIQSINGPYDFIHIDGNHSTQACYHDIQMAIEACENGGIILIDDYVLHMSVKNAVDSFIKKRAEQIDRYFRLPSLTGEFVLIKG